MHSWLEGIGKKDMNHLSKITHKDYRRITRPRSACKREQTKEEYLRHTGEILNLCGDIEASNILVHNQNFRPTVKPLP